MAGAPLQACLYNSMSETFFIITELDVAGLCAHIWLVLYHVGLKMIISTDTLVINKSSLLSLRE